MNILVSGKDVGGVRALLPVIERLIRIGWNVLIHNKGFLRNEALKFDSFCTIVSNLEFFSSAKIDVVLFSTSIEDSETLKLVEDAKSQSIKTVCLIDNWMNYSSRLLLEDRHIWPDKYLIMDEFGKQEAIQSGVPEDIIYVTGQPVFSELLNNYRKTIGKADALKETIGVPGGKKLLVFISEPAEADQGKDASNPNFRGYTEKTVFRLLCKNLLKFKNKFFLGIVYHPREEKDNLLTTWNDFSHEIKGDVLNLDSGSTAVMISDAVCGMCSILLYESSLLQKPTLSLQPNLINNDSTFLEKNTDITCIKNENNINELIQSWLQKVQKSKRGFDKEISIGHENAVENIINQISGN